jgi:hypothetical protein
MKTKWQTVRTMGYDGRYDSGPNVDRRACGGIVHIQERTKGGVPSRRAVTVNGRYSFVTKVVIA